MHVDISVTDLQNVMESVFHKSDLKQLWQIIKTKQWILYNTIKEMK